MILCGKSIVFVGSVGLRMKRTSLTYVTRRVGEYLTLISIPLQQKLKQIQNAKCATFKNSAFFFFLF